MLGTFWLPAAVDGTTPERLPDDRVAGQFEAGNGRPWNLELLGSLLPSDDPARTNPNEAVPNYDVIFGASNNHTCLSLFDAWRSSFSLFAALHDKETWSIGWYAEGKAWMEPEDRVDSITIEYDLLSDWGWPNHHIGGGYDHSEQTFHVPQTQDVTAEINGARVVLHFGWHQNIASHQYVARTQASIEIRDSVSLTKVRDEWVFPLKVLLEFLTLHYVDVKRVVAKPSDLDAQVEIHYDVHKPPDLDKRSDTGVHPIKMLATREHLLKRGIDLETLLHNYFALTNIDNHEFALWFLKESAQRLIDKTVDTSLLNAFRALERYHETALEGTAIPEDDHAARVTTIVDGSPEEHKQWVKNQLSGANRKGLGRQVREVCERSSKTASKISEVWPSFFDSAVSLRAKVAHGIPDASGDGALRFLASATGLRWILRHVYLRELGLSDHDAAETIAQCLAFQQELSLLKDWYRQLEQT